MQSLPVPPRLVRAAAARATWREFGLLATLALTITTGIGIYICKTDEWRTPRSDWWLDQESQQTVGTIKTTEQLADDLQRHTFTFVNKEKLLVTGAAWSGQRQLSTGESIAVEYLPEQPDICRVAGMHYSRLSRQWTIYATILLSTMLACALWLLRIYHTATLLRYGRATPARIVSTLAWFPFGQWVRFAYLDEAGVERFGWQLVRANSPLDKTTLASQLNATGDGAFVVHSKTAASRCRLTHLDEVAEEPA
ncbi:MAG: hypothetical protein NT107_05645 [Planctomycetota bacterium]|nr:hypothetical protein [Planctomycetota bacterium]